MGSIGSAHIKNEREEEILKVLLSEYNREDSLLNADESHNDHGKPMVVVSQEWVSLYDGSLADGGDLYPFMHLTKQISGPILGVVNANDDIASLSVLKDGETVFEAEIDYDGWIDEEEIDQNQLVQLLEGRYSAEEISRLFAEEVEDVLDFLEEFHRLTDCPFYMDYEWLSQPEEYLELIEETENINIYRKLKPFQWDEDYYSPR